MVPHPALEKYTNLVQCLAVESERLTAIRCLKNSIIGNNAKKVLFMRLGVIPKLVDILSLVKVEDSIKAQSAIVLGSFAYGSDQNVETLVEAGVIPPLLDALTSSNEKLVEAAARALNVLLQSPGVPRDEIFHDLHSEKLVAMLRAGCGNVSSTVLPELAASIMARCCETKKHQLTFEKLGAVESIFSLLSSEYCNVRTKEACIEALSAFCRDNAKIAKTIVDRGSIFTILIKYLRDKRSSMRLAAATCYTNIYRTGIANDRQQEVVQYVMPVLIKLFQDTSSSTIIRERAPLVFAFLVSDCEDLQRAAGEADAIAKLAHLLTVSFGAINSESGMDLKKKKGTSGAMTRLCENTLTAIAAVCSMREDCRKLVIDAKILPVIVKALEHSEINIRVAACQAARSLSRSVKYLRTALVDAGIGMPLFHLLADPSTNVQSIASATLCNIVLDFSPMKKIVIENGGVEKLVELANSMDLNLRLNAVWALKNLLFQADSDTKQAVMDRLTFGTLEALIEDPELQVQEQAVNLLRNLACKHEKDISLVFSGFGSAKLMSIIDKKLSYENEDVILQTLYVIVNISTGSEAHKNAIVDHESILAKVIELMSHQKSAIKIATLWVIINLTWAEDDSAANDRIDKFRSRGVEELLRSMTDEVDIEVRDRVRTALHHFHPETGGNNL